MRLFIVTFILLASIGVAPAFAALAGQAGGIQITSQRAESHFPDDMRFYLTARSPNEINEVRVYFKRSGRSAGSAYRTVQFTPGTNITGESVLRTGLGDAYIPPGTEFEYYFEVRDRAGSVLRGASQPFVYMDSRLSWQSVTSGLVTVYYYGAQGEANATAILKAAEDTLKRMGPVLGVAPAKPMRIVAYSNYSDMSGALPFRAKAVEQQLVTEGQAFSEERVLLVLASGANSDGVAEHEFAHLLVAEAAGSSIAFVPSWLNEGLAEYANPVPVPSYDSALRRAVQDDRVKPLWHLSTFSGTPQDIIVFYGQGSAVVQHLLDTYGQAKMAELFLAVQSTLDIDQALQRVYGFDQYGLDSQWRKSVGLTALPPRATAVPPSATLPAGSTPAATPVAAAPDATGRPASAPAQPGAAGCNGSAPDLAWLGLLGLVLGISAVRLRAARD
ncbi:MAG: hypothetical protein FJ316_11070 [SAR202 cluster bacterium]|nr:hypothetical protein [SAR202 cluster bacterium]